jgi:hypothetical protein
VAGFIVHATIAEGNASFAEPEGVGQHIERTIWCPNHQAGTIMELTCPGMPKGSWVKIHLYREIIWSYRSTSTEDMQCKRADVLAAFTPGEHVGFIVQKVFEDKKAFTFESFSMAANIHRA